MTKSKCHGSCSNLSCGDGACAQTTTTGSGQSCVNVKHTLAKRSTKCEFSVDNSNLNLLISAFAKLFKNIKQTQIDSANVTSNMRNMINNQITVTMENESRNLRREVRSITNDLVFAMATAIHAADAQADMEIQDQINVDQNVENQNNNAVNIIIDQEESTEDISEDEIIVDGGDAESQTVPINVTVHYFVSEMVVAGPCDLSTDEDCDCENPKKVCKLVEKCATFKVYINYSKVTFRGERRLRASATFNLLNLCNCDKPLDEQNPEIDQSFEFLFFDAIVDNNCVIDFLLEGYNFVNKEAISTVVNKNLEIFEQSLEAYDNVFILDDLDELDTDFDVSPNSPLTLDEVTDPDCQTDFDISDLPSINPKYCDFNCNNYVLNINKRRAKKISENYVQIEETCALPEKLEGNLDIVDCGKCPKKYQKVEISYSDLFTCLYCLVTIVREPDEPNLYFLVRNENFEDDLDALIDTITKAYCELRAAFKFRADGPDKVQQGCDVACLNDTEFKLNAKVINTFVCVKSTPTKDNPYCYDIYYDECVRSKYNKDLEEGNNSDLKKAKERFFRIECRDDKLYVAVKVDMNRYVHSDYRYEFGACYKKILIPYDYTTCDIYAGIVVKDPKTKWGNKKYLLEGICPDHPEYPLDCDGGPQDVWCFSTNKYHPNNAYNRLVVVYSDEECTQKIDGVICEDWDEDEADEDDCSMYEFNQCILVVYKNGHIFVVVKNKRGLSVKVGEKLVKYTCDTFSNDVVACIKYKDCGTCVRTEFKSVNDKHLDCFDQILCYTDKKGKKHFVYKEGCHFYDFHGNCLDIKDSQVKVCKRLQAKLSDDSCVTIRRYYTGPVGCESIRYIQIDPMTCEDIGDITDEVEHIKCLDLVKLQDGTILCREDISGCDQYEYYDVNCNKVEICEKNVVAAFQVVKVWVTEIDNDLLCKLPEDSCDCICDDDYDEGDKFVPDFTEDKFCPIFRVVKTQICGRVNCKSDNTYCPDLAPEHNTILTPFNKVFLFDCCYYFLFNKSCTSEGSIIDLCEDNKGFRVLLLDKDCEPIMDSDQECYVPDESQIKRDECTGNACFAVFRFYEDCEGNVYYWRYIPCIDKPLIMRGTCEEETERPSNCIVVKHLDIDDCNFDDFHVWKFSDLACFKSCKLPIPSSVYPIDDPCGKNKPHCQNC